jgi:hypothetical protein
MRNDIMNNINFRKKDLFSPNEIMSGAFEPTTLVMDSKKEMIHEEGILKVEKKGYFENFKLDRGEGNIVSITFTDKDTLVAFESEREGEYTNSLFLFNKKINRDLIKNEDLVNLFKPEEAIQVMVLHKKPQGVESIRNRVVENELESQTIMFTGRIAEILKDNNILPKKLELINHVKEKDKPIYRNK